MKISNISKACENERNKQNKTKQRGIKKKILTSKNDKKIYLCTGLFLLVYMYIQKISTDVDRDREISYHDVPSLVSPLQM